MTQPFLLCPTPKEGENEGYLSLGHLATQSVTKSGQKVDISFVMAFEVDFKNNAHIEYHSTHSTYPFITLKGCMHQSYFKSHKWREIQTWPSVS